MGEPGAFGHIIDWMFGAMWILLGVLMLGAVLYMIVAGAVAAWRSFAGGC